MARRPDPPGLQAAKGSPGKRQKRDRQVETIASTENAAASTAARISPMPAVKGQAATFWKALAPELERLNFLRPSDRNAFSRYCVDTVRYWDVTEELEKKGYTYTTASAHGTMDRVNPLFLVQERLGRRLEALEDRFGLTPAARQQIMLRIMATGAQLPLFGKAADDKPDAPAVAAPPSPIGFLTSIAKH